MKVCSDCGRCYDDVVSSCVEETHPPLSETRNGSSEIFDDYRLDFCLESDSRTQLYRARQTASDRSCLIRLFSADEERSQKFLEEAKLAASFFHPNVADVYDAGRLDTGELFVVSEQTEGQTLRELLQTVGLPQLLTTVQVVRQAAEALHKLHLQGLTHRAVRPENIILTTDLEHRLLVKVQNPDLGGVSEHAIISDKFSMDSAVDSLKYFAPEQFSGEAANAQTDVYALGVVFYEMLAGAPPFEADKAAELAEKHKHQTPPEIKINNFDLRMLITHALTESLQKRPSLRQSSANTLARQLRHIEQLATHSPTPPPVVTVPQEKPQFNFAAASGAVPAKSFQPISTRPTAKEVPATFKIENEPLETPVTYLEETAEIRENKHPLTESQIDAKFANKPGRSRLKARKKRLHSTITPHVFEMKETDPVPAAEPSTPVLAQTYAAPQKIPIVQIETETVLNTPKIKPKKIEWVQPEDDIPSEAEVREVLAKGHVDETPVFEPAPERAAFADAVIVAAVAVEPKKIELDLSEDDILLQTDIVEILSKDEIIDIPFAIEEPDEITLVSAPHSRIRVEWDRPVEWRDIYSDDEFPPADSKSVGYFPTILGNAENKSTFDRKDAMFSAYYDGSRRFSIRSRTLMIGGGALALTLAFLFGDDFLNGYVQTASSNDSAAVTADSTPTSQSQISWPALVMPNGKTTLPKAGDTASLRATPVLLNPRKPILAGKSPAEKEKDEDKNQPSKAEPAIRNAANARTTLVISSDDGKVKSNVEPAKRSADTRPRIVENPKP